MPRRNHKKHRSRTHPTQGLGSGWGDNELSPNLPKQVRQRNRSEIDTVSDFTRDGRKVVVNPIYRDKRERRRKKY